MNKYKIKFSNQSTEAENSYAVTILKTSTFSVQSADLSHNALFAS